jgi:hypothetical protein
MAGFNISRRVDKISARRKKVTQNAAEKSGRVMKNCLFKPRRLRGEIARECIDLEAPIMSNGVGELFTNSSPLSFDFWVICERLVVHYL